MAISYPSDRTLLWYDAFDRQKGGRPSLAGCSGCISLQKQVRYDVPVAAMLRFYSSTRFHKINNVNERDDEDRSTRKDWEEESVIADVSSTVLVFLI